MKFFVSCHSSVAETKTADRMIENDSLGRRRQRVVMRSKITSIGSVTRRWLSSVLTVISARLFCLQIYCHVCWNNRNIHSKKDTILPTSRYARSRPRRLLSYSAFKSLIICRYNVFDLNFYEIPISSTNQRVSSKLDVYDVTSPVSPRRLLSYSCV